jgi:RNA polymerase sigma-70 factor (ECF subfamily)
VALNQIKAGLTRLTAKQRQVIVLRFLEGKSLAETAAIVGRNGGAVKKLHARGPRLAAACIDCLCSH